MVKVKCYEYFPKALYIIRGHTLSSTSQPVTETDCVGREAFSFTSPGHNECWRASSVQIETLYTQMVSQFWERYGRAPVDLFALHKNTNFPLFFSLVRDDVPMGVGALACYTALRVSSIESDRTNSKMSKGTQ